jgi:hypothetical protein
MQPMALAATRLMTQPLRFSLLSRSWCHLCDDMLAALRRELQALSPGSGHHVDVIDVDADPALVEKYDELVPVLLGTGADGRTVEICHYFLDRDRLIEFLRAASICSAS